MNLMYIIYQKYYNLKKTLMDDASSTYVNLCLIICSVFYLILFGSNIETNMVDFVSVACTSVVNDLY
jgi:hypothetical protein